MFGRERWAERAVRVLYGTDFATGPTEQPAGFSLMVKIWVRVTGKLVPHACEEGRFSERVGWLCLACISPLPSSSMNLAGVQTPPKAHQYSSWRELVCRILGYL